MKIIHLAFAMLLNLFCLAAFAEPHWAKYENSRYGYSVSYPSNIFTPQEVSGNGDGREFIARNNDARFSIWANYNALNETPQTMAINMEEDCHARASYRVIRANMVVISCQYRGTIYYKKTMIRGDLLTQFSMTYPAANRTKWDAIHTRIARSIVPAN